MRRVNFVKEAMKKLSFDGGYNPRARFWWGGDDKKEEVQQTSDRPNQQQAAGDQLGAWAQKYLDQYVPGKEYEGKFTAPASAQETAGLGWLDKYLGEKNATGDLFGAGKEELMKTLTGKYDPRTSDFYKSTREGALQNEEDVIDRMRRGAGVRGSLFQDTSLRDESKVRQGTGTAMDTILAGLAEKERGNRLTATTQALNYDKYEQAAPLAKASAALTLGALPRMLEQADLESQYKDFLRKQEELGKVPGIAQNYYGTQAPNYGYSGSYEAPSAFERIMGVVAPVAGGVLGSFLGPVGTAAGSAAGNAMFPAAK